MAPHHTIYLISESYVSLCSNNNSYNYYNDDNDDHTYYYT